MEFLSRLELPCGLFVVDDSLGAVVLRAAYELGLDVPRDLAVLGFGNDPACCHASFPPLSSIPYPGREIGYAAAALLRDMMDGADPGSGRTEVPVGEVVSRESSDTLAIDDVEIRSILRRIRSEAPRDALKVSELEVRGKLSLSTIKTRFKTYLGHGPKQEIQLVRLRHLTRLLHDDSLSLAKIAERMAFGSAHELSRFFLSATGRRPSEFRELLRTGKVRLHDRASKAVIFDMDGTLFDTEEIYYKAYSRALAAQGGDLSRDTYFQTLMGLSNMAIERYIRDSADAGFDHKRFMVDWRAEFRAMLNETSLKPLPGVLDTLEFLCEEGVLLALASSSDRDEIDACLEISGLAPYFSIRASGDEVREAKPDPAVYLLACERLGLSPAICVAVEDSIHGQSAALAAGMRVVRVTTANIPEPLPAGVTHATMLDKLTPSDWKGILMAGDTDWIQTSSS